MFGGKRAKNAELSNKCARRDWKFFKIWKLMNESGSTNTMILLVVVVLAALVVACSFYCVHPGE